MRCFFVFSSRISHGLLVIYPTPNLRYVVYDPGQVVIRYVAQVDFQFR